MSSGLRTAVRIVIVVIAALVALGTVGGLGALAYGLGGSRVVNDTQALPAGMRSLTIDTGDLPVTVRLVTDDDATESRVDLRMLARSDDTQLAVISDDADSRVTLGDSGLGFLFFNGIGEVEVVLPPDVAEGLSVTVRHRAGSLVTDADLERLVAKIEGGSVTLGGSARFIDVDVGHGDISTSTRIAVAESFKATTESGRISMEFRAAPRTTEATANGDVTVGLPGPGPYRVRAESAGPLGRTTVTVPETTDPSAPRVSARSTSGNVKVVELR